MIAIVLAVGLPEADDIEGMKNDEYYRVIYGFPWVFQALTIIMLLTCYKEDSIVFLIQNEDDEGALKNISKLYSANEDPKKVLEVIKSRSSSNIKGAKGGSEKTHISITQACCDPRYRRATWVAFTLCFF